MTIDDGQGDDPLASVSCVRTWDVSPRHAHQLRRRCHAFLQRQSGPKGSPRRVSGMRFRRAVAPALGGAWCVAYLVELIRFAAAVYRGIQ